jgi:hypothetical protein
VAMRDIFGIAVAVLIALASLIVEPWSRGWWTGMVAAGSIAAISAIDIILGAFDLRKKVHPIFTRLETWLVLPLALSIIFLIAMIWRLSLIDTSVPPASNIPQAAVSPPIIASNPPAGPPVITSSPSQKLILDVTPDYLMHLYEDRTSIQADKLAATYIGKLIHISGTISDIYGQGVFLENKRPKIITIALNFKMIWKERLEIMSKHQKISAECEVKRIGISDLELDNCDMLP